MFGFKFNQKRRVKMPFKLRHAAFFTAIACVVSVAACAPRNQSANNAEVSKSTATTSSTTQSSSQTANSGGEAPPIASAHGGSSGVMPPLGSRASSGETPSMDTAALDAKIEQAERKAKTPGASDADKRAAAAAYLERGDLFYNAGQPSLYKFALRDLRRVLRYQPDNAKAREESDMIVSIYQSMNRPVPELGNEP